jgi:hypothetical protein
MLQSLGINIPGGGFGGLGGFGGQGGGGASARTGPAGAEKAGPQVSAIRTRFLAMRLDHATGTMEGEVLTGPFVGRQLRDLDLDSLMRMLELYRESDGQSANLLETYLDRERGADWRNRDPGSADGGSKGEGGPMAEPEAWSILGLKPGSDAGAIRDAHRRLMQKLHPDRGGSDYLAAKINEAKRVLMKERT